jgi:hypothetical protein
VMAKKDVYLGWDGNCREHRTTPTIMRRTEDTLLLEHKSCGRPIIASVLEIHCATGHQYLAVSRDEWMHDPWDNQEEATLQDTIRKELEIENGG